MLTDKTVVIMPLAEFSFLASLKYVEIHVCMNTFLASKRILIRVYHSRHQKHKSSLWKLICVKCKKKRVLCNNVIAKCHGGITYNTQGRDVKVLFLKNSVQSSSSWDTWNCCSVQVPTMSCVNWVTVQFSSAYGSLEPASARVPKPVVCPSFLPSFLPRPYPNSPNYSLQSKRIPWNK